MNAIPPDAPMWQLTQVDDERLAAANRKIEELKDHLAHEQRARARAEADLHWVRAVKNHVGAVLHEERIETERLKAAVLNAPTTCQETFGTIVELRAKIAEFEADENSGIVLRLRESLKYAEDKLARSRELNEALRHNARRAILELDAIRLRSFALYTFIELGQDVEANQREHMELARRRAAIFTAWQVVPRV